MLRFKLVNKIQEAGFHRPFSFLHKTMGFGTTKTAKYVKDVQQSISLADLTRLCLKLHCTPNDLFYWRATTRLPLPEGHPIADALTAPNEVSGWQETLNSLPDDEKLRFYNEMNEVAMAHKKKGKTVGE